MTKKKENKVAKKTSKKRAEKYDPKLKIDGKFIDVINAAVSTKKK
jgi:hypothetical protein